MDVLERLNYKASSCNMCKAGSAFESSYSSSLPGDQSKKFPHEERESRRYPVWNRRLASNFEEPRKNCIYTERRVAYLSRCSGVPRQSKFPGSLHIHYVSGGFIARSPSVSVPVRRRPRHSTLHITFTRCPRYLLSVQTRLLAGARPQRTPSFQSHSLPGLDLLFAGSQGEYHCMWRCPRPGLNPSGLVNNSSLAAGPQFTEMKIL